jgi:hypothetical protein
MLAFQRQCERCADQPGTDDNDLPQHDATLSIM